MYVLVSPYLELRRAVPGKHTLGAFEPGNARQISDVQDMECFHQDTRVDLNTTRGNARDNTTRLF